ncbi:protein kinase domain-containing protein [Neorhodopirellula pilleata]|uniref:protein kinase domain-containing protein n=1 Tax=Neorhodopirellula pilleata TaxID=2714738 RepID=UPI0036F31E26
MAEVGRGGWGIVEKAFDRQLDREVAVKRFCDVNDVSEQERQRFLHEAKVTSQLQHPGIVPVHELGDRRDAFYVMKLLDGITLAKYIQDHHQAIRQTGNQTRFQFGDSLEPLLQRFVDVCHAVAYAHQRGVVHRDLKPSNVMISDFGETVVLDWGLAQSVESRPPESASTTVPSKPVGLADVSSLFEPDGTVIGTPAYMSPEQARGEVSRINISSDLYSLGVVLYTIIAGRHPYQGQSVDSILQQVRNADYPDLRTIQPLTPTPLLSIVRKAMSASQHDRYPDAQELAQDVRRFIAGDSVSVHRENGLERAIRWCRHHQGVAATAAISTTALLVAALVFAVFLHRSHRAERIARIEAQQAHREAILQLGETLEATDTWLVELSGSLQFYPGMASIRSELLDRAIEQYEGIASQNIGLTEQAETSRVLGTFDLRQCRNDTEQLALLERIKTHLRLGDLYRLTDQIEDACRQYAAAESLLNDTGDDDEKWKVRLVSVGSIETKLESQFGIERVNSLIGQLLLPDSAYTEPPSIERIHAARQWLDEQLLNNLSIDQPTCDAAMPPLVARAASAAVRLELAYRNNLKVRRHHSWTEPPYLRAIEIASWLVRQRGTVGDRRLSETIQTDNSRRLQDAENYERAQESWSRLINDLDQWIQLDSDRIDYLQSSAHALLQRGNIRVRLGMLQEAAADFKDSITHLDTAWRLTDDDEFYRVNLATSKNNLGTLLSRGGQRDPELAGQLLRQSLQTYEALLREEITYDILHRYAQTHAALSNLIFESADASSRALSIDHAKKSLDAFEILKDYQPLQPDDVSRCNQLRLRIDSVGDVQ